ncbi:peptide chain release factor N(5)-glutamine methyltransferase [Bosea sp. 117]|uniref:peptide chain release factor N(5)-glutamine methyltransferase n=1 Tax=Bosea sp. 117 TaxID=1125973 RepID=UPI000494BA58|nr:peptide chain release factor N(5)-glutamine methyltransferase [Bosea sp. 117]
MSRSGAGEASRVTTRAEASRAVAGRLATAGIEAPEREARLLVRLALGLSELDLVTRADIPLTPEETVRLDALAARRAQGEPLARLAGRREFWSLDFTLSAGTLVPRPETETLVEAVLAAFPDAGAALHVLDLGTGTGAILAAILSERPAAFGVGVDLSEDAARTARDNLVRLGLGARSAVLVGRWGAALSGRFDLVVSNPPYIASGDVSGLPLDVRDHDPHLALDGGADGLDAYRAIARQLAGLLAPGGRAVLELGAGQETDVAEILSVCGIPPDGPARRDLAGIARAIVTAPFIP